MDETNNNSSPSHIDLKKLAIGATIATSFFLGFINGYKSIKSKDKQSTKYSPFSTKYSPFSTNIPFMKNGRRSKNVRKCMGGALCYVWCGAATCLIVPYPFILVVPAVLSFSIIQNMISD